MINFRFHLVSIVAVFLALAVGISLGSGFVGEAVLGDLRNRLDDVRNSNEDLRRDVRDLNDRLNANEDFGRAAKPWLTGEALEGEEIVVVRFENTDGEVDEGVRSSIEEAGGEVLATLTVTDRFALPGDPEIDELALILGSESPDPGELRTRAASQLGSRLAAAAAQPEGAGLDSGFNLFAQRLERAGYVAMEQGEQTAEAGLGGAAFVITGGGEAEPSFDVMQFTLDLIAGLSLRNAPILVAEDQSGWGLTDEVRGALETTEDVSTVDGADTLPGQVAVVLGLNRAMEGVYGHYGSGDGATGPIPEPPLGS